MTELSKKHSEIRKLIKERSPFDEKETNRILDYFFSTIPTNVRILIHDYQFNKNKVLDIGCSYGMSLLYWREDSEGIEIQDHMVQFVRSLGRIVHKLNVEEGFSGLRKENYDAIYSNNLIEHLVAPHLFLVRLHSLLKPGGILAIGYPLVPPFPFRNLWKLIGYRGWLAVEHVNFFTAETSKLILERAGFRVIHQYFPRFYRISVLNKIGVLIGIQCLSVCQRIDEFKYNPKRLPKFDPSWCSDLKHFR
jgi:SAM-dependent methyltransferase